VTGGTGSFGKKFVEMVLRDHPEVARLVIFSRDELKQFEMAQIFPTEKYPCLRYFIGDIRDKSRLDRALEGIDTVVHAAAMKQVPTAEYNPFECIKTNVLGAQNLIEAVLDSDVTRVVALSTDKAAAPINLYGATKLCSDKLFVAANNLRGRRDLRLSIVRYGNVMGSRGSVIPFFMERRKSGVIPITDPSMTRFNISLQEGVELVLHALKESLGGELYVPKLASYRITDVAQAVAPNCEQRIIGVRPGEKLHEEMVPQSDSPNTIENQTNYIILPSLTDYSREETRRIYLQHHAANPIDPSFRYASDTNTSWLSVDSLRELIVRHIDPSFSIV